MSVTEDEVATLLQEPATGAPPPVTEEEVAGLFEEHDSSERGRLKSILDLSLTKQPDKQASVLELARQTSIPSDVVERRFDDFKQAWEQSQTDVVKFQTEHPDLAELVLKRPELGPVVWKDEPLFLLKKALKFITAPVPDASDPAFKWTQGKFSELGVPMPGEEQRQEALVEAQKGPEKRPYMQTQAAKLTGVDRLLVPFVAGKVAAKQVEYSKLGFQLLQRRVRGESTYEIEKQLLDMREWLAPRDYGQTGALEDLAVTMAEAIPSQWEVLKGAGVLGGGTALLAAGAGTLLTKSAAGAKAGVRVAKPLIKFMAGAGAFLSSFELETGSAYMGMLEAETDDGKPVDPNVAIGASLLYGLAAASAETVSLGVEAKAFDPLLSGGRASLAGLLKDAGFRQLAWRAGAAWLRSGGSEGIEEFTQQFTQELATWGAKSVTAGRAQGFDVEKVLGSSLEAGAKGMVAGFGMAAPGPLLNIASGAVLLTNPKADEMIANAKAQRGSAIVKAILSGGGEGGGLKDSLTLRAAPEELARIIQRETADMGEEATHLYTDPQAFVRLCQSKNEDPAQVAVEMLGEGGDKALREALVAGMKLEIPLVHLDRWMKRPEIAEALAPDTTTRPWHLTSREMEAQTNERGAEDEQVRQLAEKFEKEGIEPQSVAESKFVEVMEKQLASTEHETKATARTKLSLLRALVRTVPERFGTGATADQLFKRFAIAIGNAEPVTVGSAQQTADVEPGSVPVLREEFAKLDPESQLRALVLDRNTGLLNAQGFQALRRDPERPYLAEFDLEGKKAFNDAHGHGSVDGALRLMAGALREAGVTDGAALGGAIKAWVASPEQAQEIAAIMEKAVGDDIRVTAGVTEEMSSLSGTFEAAGEAHKATKDALQKEGKLGHRKGAPGAFWKKDAPEVNWEEKVGDPGLDLKSPEFKALMAEAMGRAEPTAKRFKAAPTVDRFSPSFDTAGLSDAVREWAENFEGDYFEAVHRDETGMLTDEGFALAQKRSPKAFTVSADMRGLKDLNDFFGKAGANVVIREFKKLIIRKGGAKFDAAHPHGDEFFAQGDNESDLQDFLNAVELQAKKHFFVQRRSDGGGVIQEGIHFAYGLGKDLDEADRVALPAAKERQGSVSGPQEFKTDVELERRIAELEQGGGRRTNLKPRQSDRQGGVRPGVGDVDGRGVRQGDGQNQGDASGGEDEHGNQKGARSGFVDQSSPETLAEVRNFISKMRKKNRAVATAFLDFILDPESNSRPEGITKALEEKFFFTFDLYDPLRGRPQVDLRTNRVVFGGPKLKGADTSGKKKRGGGRQSGELLKEKLRRTMSAEEYMNLGYDAFEQPAFHEGARGYTAIAQKGLDKLFRIVLSKDADPTTFLHESAHVFLEMFADLAARDDAPQQVRDDFAAAMKWAGARGDWRSLDAKEKERVHEQFARGFEAYLFEGKAPSVAMAGVFQRLSDWVKATYRSIASLNVELNDDIRGVFDRLLAADREIEAMKGRMGISAQLFRSPEDMAKALGREVRPEEWQAYLDDYRMAHTRAARALELRVLKDRLRAKEAWWKEELKTQREIAEVEYEALPARMAQQYLWGRSGEGGRVHLERAAVEAVVGTEGAKRFPLKKDGATPGSIAGLHGFATGEAMLEAVAALPDKDAWVKEHAEEAMREKFPELLDERAKLQEEAAKGLHGDLTVAWLERELKALGSRANAEHIKRAAKQIANGREVGRLDVGGVLAQERAAASQAMKALAKGNHAQAAEAKIRQLLNVFLHRELTAAREDRDAFEELASDMAKLSARAKLGKASPVYRGGVDALLDAFGLKGPSGHDTPLPSIKEVVSAMEADGATVMFDAELVGELVERGESWKKLTVAEMRAVRDALLNIRGAARSKNNAIIEGKRVEKEQVVERLAVEAAAILKDKGAATTKESETLLEKLLRQGSSIDGWLLRMETMIGFLVNDNVNSTWFRAIVNPLQEAKHKEADLLEAVVRPIVEAFDKVPERVRARFMEPVDGAKLFPDHIKNLDPPRRRFELLMIALNAGNDGNLQRLTDGRNISVAQIQAAIDLLTKEEMDWVQSVLDAHENPVLLPGETEARSLKERAFDLEERDSGLRPEEVRARPIVTRHGTYRGGYFPAVYHAEMENLGKRQEAQSIAEILDPSFSRAGTSHGHLKRRAQKVKGAISLSPGTIYTHLARAAHDIAYREPLKSVSGLILTPDIQEALRARLGTEKAKLFLPWLKDIGTMRAGMDWGGLNSVAQWLRSNMAPALLGWRPSVAIGDAANLTVARLSLGHGYLEGALKEYATNFRATEAMVLEKSGEMRSRRTQLTREFAQAVKEITASGPLKRGAIAKYKRGAFFFMEQSDRLTSMPAWLAAYRQAVANGKGEVEAVLLADKFVRDRFPSHNAVDMAHLLRDKGFWGYVTVFASYMNVLYNRQRHIIQPLLNAEGLGQKARLSLPIVMQLLALWTVGNVLPALLMGQGPDEGEKWRNWYWRRLAMAPFENFHGELGGSAGGLLTGKRPNQRGSPVSGYLGSVAGALQRATDGDMNTKDLKAIVQTIGLSTGVPVTPVNNTLDMLLGKDNEDVFDYASDAVYGERKTSNPISIIGDAQGR